MELGILVIVTILAFFKGAKASLKGVIPKKSPQVILWAFLFGGAICAVTWPVWVTWKIAKTIQGRINHGHSERNKGKF